MCISCKISEDVREKLGIAASVLGVLLCICGLFLIFTGVYIKFEIDDQVMLLEGYRTGMLPHFLVSIGTLAACLNGIGSKIAYDCGHSETRGRFQQILLFFIIVMFLFCWVILAGGIVSITHGGNIETAFERGLKSAMERYSHELPVKQTIDKLQMSMHCCGSSSYKDWFTVDWINRDSLNTNHPDFQR
ncbi:hypothetical protein ACJMK2_037877 [Sinanodonta woodiana]|uniref:Tetraspanin n=1 Tax=Sinanodonta woodiana TaxID=1069815 RepID=A0ABD3WLT7_SINWO